MFFVVNLGLCVCIVRRREANLKANKGKRDREDLYTDNWDGSVWKGSKLNALAVRWLVTSAAQLDMA